MARLLVMAGGLLAILLAAGVEAAERAEKPQPADEPLDKVTGDYVGAYVPACGAEEKADAKVIAEGGGNYRVALFMRTGDGAPSRIELAGKTEGRKVALAGKAGDVEWSGAIEAGGLVAESKSGKCNLKFTVKKSPTEGRKPPAGAVILIPFAEGKPPAMDEWTNSNWLPQADGSVLVAKGDNRTKRLFGDMQLHLEFRVPFEPSQRAQGRGNSGVYIQDLYEIQILDSFGLEPKASECGAVYTQTAPKENACLPPGAWQTYDITFLAPRFDADGRKVKDAVVTVVQNGVKVHDGQAIRGPTGAAKGRPEVKKGPLRLQEHGHPVRFRNVWLVEQDERDAATSP
jgi:hypothetical protein